MEKRFHFRKLLVSLLVAASVVVKAQTSVDPTVMNVAGKDVPLSEFVYIAGKNSEVNLADSASLGTYLELFKKFKLKVAEAESLGMDTTQSFVNELKGYQEQLLKSYSKDSGEVLTPDKIRHIEQNYPEYKHLMQEYRDGILLLRLAIVKSGAEPHQMLPVLRLFLSRLNRSIHQTTWRLFAAK